MEDCCGINLVKKKPSKLDKTRPKPITSGLMICTPCIESMTIRVGYLTPWFTPHCFREHTDRLFLHGYSCQGNIYSSAISHPQLEAATGERVGPIVHGNYIKQIESTCRTRRRRVQLLEERLAMIDQNENQKETERADAFVDAFEIAAREFPAFEKAKEDLKITETGEPG
jgi:hypothetical protein